MKVKKYYPILVHMIVCVCWYVLNLLFFIGPEPGILTQYVYNCIEQQLATVMMTIVVVAGLSVTFCAYFSVGKQIRNIDLTDKIKIVLSVIFFNLLIFLILVICTQNINAAIYYSQFTFNAPFFVLLTQSNLSKILSLIIFSITPSIIICFGAIS